MSTGTFYPVADADDGCWAGNNFYSPGQCLQIWTSYNGFVLFDSVTVPNGATINSAYVRYRAYEGRTTGTGQSVTEVGFSDEDNAAAPTDATEANAKVLTTATTLYTNIDYTGGTWYNSPDIASALQELVNRGGWVSGNSALLLYKSYSDSSAGLGWRKMNSYDSGSEYRAELHVDYTAGEQEVSASDGISLGDSVDGMSLSATQSDGVSLGDSVDAQRNADSFSDGVTLGDSVDAQRNADEFTEGVLLADVVDATDPNARVADGSLFSDAAATQITYNAPAVTDGFDLGDTIDGQRNADEYTEGVVLSDGITGLREVYGAYTDGTVLADSADAFNFTQWLADNANFIQRRYELTLTGAADGVANAELPMSSFQCRMRQSEPTYMSVVVPSHTYAATINARSNGELVVEMVAYVNGTEALREEVCRVDLEGIRIDQGARKSSITLDGHKTKTYGANRADLEAVTYQRLDEGKHTYRCAYPNWYLKPGSTAVYDENEITVSQVTINVNATQASMEVTDG